MAIFFVQHITTVHRNGTHTLFIQGIRGEKAEDTLKESSVKYLLLISLVNRVAAPTYLLFVAGQRGPAGQFSAFVSSTRYYCHCQYGFSQLTDWPTVWLSPNKSLEMTAKLLVFLQPKGGCGCHTDREVERVGLHPDSGVDEQKVHRKRGNPIHITWFHVQLQNCSYIEI